MNSTNEPTFIYTRCGPCKKAIKAIRPSTCSKCNITGCGRCSRLGRIDISDCTKCNKLFCMDCDIEYGKDCNPYCFKCVEDYNIEVNNEHS